MMASARANSLFNLPNNLTTSRLFLAFLLFALIAWHQWLAAFVVFVIAGITDGLDGYFARRYGLTSAIGRMYDPLVDKVLVCGAFVFLAEVHASGLPGDANVHAWMITVLLTREFLVTGIRGFVEEKGIQFGADWLGKLKMVLQSVAIGWLLLAFWLVGQGVAAAPLALLRDILNWTAVLVTIASGLQYLFKAMPHLVSN